MFHSIARQYINTDSIITLRNTHGKPLVLQHVRQANKGSAEASARTARERSQNLERHLQLVSVAETTTLEQVVDHTAAQQASLLQRNTDQFVTAANKAGLKVLGQFTPQQAAGIKRMMPWTMWCAVKRALHSVLGYDVLGTTQNARDTCAEHYFQYDFGSFQVTEKGKKQTAHFLRVKSVQEVVARTMERLALSGDLAAHSNFPNDCLWLMLAGDKGGSSTKLMLVFVNAKKQHSVHTGQLLALFQGCNDSRRAIKIVFGPLYKEAEDLIQRLQ